MLAAQCDDRANGDPRRFHVDQKEADAFLLLRILVGADEEESPVGMLRQRRPGLLPVDDIVVAVAHGRCAQAGKIRTRARLRIALDPPILDRQDARKEMSLLLGRADSVDDRTDHRETKDPQAVGVATTAERSEGEERYR